MLRRTGIAIVVALLLVGSLGLVGVSAQSATNAVWSTSITYYTPSDTGGTLQISYYPEGGGSRIDAAPITLAPHKAGSLFIGAVSGMTNTFSGSAVLSADVPVVATAVNLAGNDYPRPLYSGFDASQASDTFFIASVLYRKFGSTSLLSIQNIGQASVNATLSVYAAGATTPAFQHTYNIPAQAAELVPAGDMGLSAGFTGSAVVSAPGGSVVAVAQETDDAGRGAKAFEGVAGDGGGDTLFMASMMCRAFGGQTSYYAIQNVGSPGTANVEIDFYDKDGAKVYTATGLSIGPGNKISENPCKYTSNAAALEGISGSAVIRSTNGMPLVAIGKVSGAGGTPTAFLGQTAGDTKVAAPYIRWKANPTQGERAFVAIMNVGSGNATSVVARYYNNQGVLAATHTLATSGDPLPRFIKVNTNPSSGNALDGNGDFGVNPYGGAIEIESDQPVVVVVRVSKTVSYGSTTKFAEDYNAISVP